ncbi:MAG: YkgJ family cysteine cluster protein [Myxococcota bacterium]
MLYAIPRLRSDLRLTPLEDPSTGELVYQLTCPQVPGVLQLAREPIVWLMFLDGQITVQGACKRSRLMLGITPPPQMAMQLVAALYQLGFAEPVAIQQIPHRVLPGTEHICEGCGRSCEGHMVGPLPPDEVQTILDLFDALAAKVPRLRGRNPTMRRKEEPSQVFLALDGSRCLFLDDDRSCAIHRHFGPEAKPSICRMFPYARVYTEAGLRVGVRSVCYRHHAHWTRSQGSVEGPLLLDGELASLPPIIDQAAPYAWEPFHLNLERLMELRTGVESLEQRLLEVLGDHACTLPALIATLRQQPTSSAFTTTAAMGVVPAAAATLGQQVLRRALDELDLTGTMLGYVMHHKGPGLPDTYRAFMATLEAVASRQQPPQDLPMPRLVELFLLDHARRMVWNRDMIQYSNPADALAVLVLGFVVGLMSAAPDQSAEALVEHTATCVASWQRTLVAMRGETLFQGDESAVFLDAWMG